MSTAVTAVDPARDSPTDRGGPRRPNRRRAIAIGLLGTALLAATVLGMVHATDAAALGRVRVFLDSRSLTCEDPADVTTVTRGDEGGGSETYAVPAVRGSADLDCRLSVVVRNDSDRVLDVDRVTFTLLGPESRVGLHTDHVFTQGLEPYPGGDRADVVYDYVDDPDNRAPYPVGAGSSQRFDFHLTSDGCRQAGATTTWTGSPAFTATVGTATQDLTLDGAGFGFVGARTANQPCR